MQQILTLDSFLHRVDNLADISEAYDVFEFECTDVVRDNVLCFADAGSVEPFRSAMYNLGFVTY